VELKLHFGVLYRREYECLARILSHFDMLVVFMFLDMSFASLVTLNNQFLVTMRILLSRLFFIDTQTAYFMRKIVAYPTAAEVHFTLVPQSFETHTHTKNS
jgi:hypothetical protein